MAIPSMPIGFPIQSVPGSISSNTGASVVTLNSLSNLNLTIVQCPSPLFFGQPFVFSAGTVGSSGLVLNTQTYYVISTNPAAGTFQFATSITGAALTTTGVSSGLSITFTPMNTPATALPGLSTPSLGVTVPVAVSNGASAVATMTAIANAVVTIRDEATGAPVRVYANSTGLGPTSTGSQSGSDELVATGAGVINVYVPANKMYTVKGYLPTSPAKRVLAYQYQSVVPSTMIPQHPLQP